MKLGASIYYTNCSIKYDTISFNFPWWVDSIIMYEYAENTCFHSQKPTTLK